MGVPRGDARSLLCPTLGLQYPPAPRHIDIEFDDSYKAHGTFVQCLSAEPRIPKPEGMQYVPETNAEVHYMLLGILLRPVRLPEVDLEVTQPERMLQADPNRACRTGN